MVCCAACVPARRASLALMLRFCPLKLCPAAYSVVCLNRKCHRHWFPIQRHCCHIQRHRSIAVGDRFFYRAQRLRTDRQPLRRTAHRSVSSAPSAQFIAHQQTCWSVSTGRDIRCPSRPVRPLWVKSWVFMVRGPPLSEGATVAGRCTAEPQGWLLNGATVIQRTGIESA